MKAEPPLPAACERVRRWLADAGHAATIRQFAQTTRSAADAAAAVGCDVREIAKSLIFRTRSGAKAIMVVASGANRVDEAKLAAVLQVRVDGEPIVRADADFVRDRTGFAIGGVPPVAHASPVIVVIDRDLMDLPRIWAAAGTPHAVFALTPEELARLTAGIVADIAVRPA